MRVPLLVRILRPKGVDDRHLIGEIDGEKMLIHIRIVVIEAGHSGSRSSKMVNIHDIEWVQQVIPW